MRKDNFRLGKIIFIFSLAAIVLFSNLNLAIADGGIIMPPGRQVYETDQKAVIFYDQGQEDLILSITFRGNANEFAWIVPTPTKPEVEKSAASLFTNLKEFTTTSDYEQYPVAEQNSLGAGKQSGGVAVLDSRQIDYYDINVLAADSKDALYTWLKDNGYKFPQSGKYITDEYIQKGWVFTAIKINDRAGANIPSSQLRTGNAIPLKLSFKTDKIVYPLKISALNGVNDEAPAGEVTYVTGHDENNAAQLDLDRTLATDKVVDGFKDAKGKISFYLKKADDSYVGDVVTIEKKYNDYYDRESGIVIRNSFRNTYVFEWWSGGVVREAFSVDLGSDFRKNEWQKFEYSWTKSSAGGIDLEFSIDDTARTTNKTEYGEYANPADQSINKKEEKAKVIIGGMENMGDYAVEEYEGMDDSPAMNYQDNTSYFSDRDSNLMIDDILIQSNNKDIFQADFENNLNVELLDDTDVLRVFEQNVSSENYPRSMGVLLYIFADKKQDIPGFNTQFAGWMMQDEIKNLALIDGKSSWVNPTRDKYYLTKLYRYMNASEMNEDLYPQASKDQETDNLKLSSAGKTAGLVGLLLVSALSMAAMIYVMLKTKK